MRRGNGFSNDVLTFSTGSFRKKRPFRSSGMAFARFRYVHPFCRTLIAFLSSAVLITQLASFPVLVVE